MSVHRKVVVVLLVAAGLISCSFVTRFFSPGDGNDSSQPTPPVEIVAPGNLEIINHPRPDLQVDIQPFIDAGCQGENNYVMECAADSPLRQLGCDYISVNDLSGGLDPAYPVATCTHRDSNAEPPELSLFEKTGCLVPLYTANVVWVDGTFLLLNGAADFEAIFAPIESENEALSYAMLVTGLNAVYGRPSTQDTDYQYLVDRLEDTHVVQTDEGFVVSLFSGPEPLCGCGTHIFSQHDVLVRSDGQVEFLDSIPVYQLEACFD